MRIGMYDPYMHILGGAERYILMIAQSLSKNGTITIYASDKTILQKATDKFGLPFTNLHSQPWPLTRSERNQQLKAFDYFFYITDGSLFFAKARKNILIIQTPDHIPALSIINRFKFSSWQKIICYSYFMSQLIKERIGKQAEVLFVPIQPPTIMSQTKKNLILSVGRFFPNLHNKKQKEMISFFKELVDEGLTDTELVLVGSIDPHAQDYFREVQTLAKNYPIRILTDVSYKELSQLYEQSKVYWHATGFGEDLKKHPEKAEHFGVTTVEAMSYGAVPVVFAGGGQVEIVTPSHNGFVWNNANDLKKYTIQLLTDSHLWRKLSIQAIKQSQTFSQENFCRKLYEIIEG